MRRSYRDALTKVWKELFPFRTPPIQTKTFPGHSKYPTIWEALFEVQGHRCFHCSRVMYSYWDAVERNYTRGTIDRAKTRATRDHIIPLHEQRRKGWHIPIYENAILACGTCNNKRARNVLSKEDLKRARDINQQALILFSTATVYLLDQVVTRVFGPDGRNHTRELRSLRQYPTSQWVYLFQESCRALSKQNLRKRYFGLNWPTTN